MHEDAPQPPPPPAAPARRSLAWRICRRVGIALFVREERECHWGVTLVAVVCIVFSLFVMHRIANPDNTRQYICHAARFGNYRAVRHLLYENMALRDARMGGLSVLHWAVIGGDVEVVKLLVHHGADINDADNAHRVTPLHIAAAEDHAKVLRYLLAKNADINAEDGEGATPLDYAQAYGQEAVVDFLRDRGGESRNPLPDMRPPEPPEAEENEIA